MNDQPSIPDQPSRTTAGDPHPKPQRDAWMRGYIQGHETGAAASTITADIVRELEATAWDDGYDRGRTDGDAAARADIAQTLADLTEQHAELAATWRTIGRLTHGERVAQRVAAMEKLAITNWPGLDNGGVLPSANWARDTSTLPIRREHGARTEAA